MRRILVVADQTVRGDALAERLALKHSTDAALDLYLVVPARPEEPGLADKRLEVDLEAYRRRGYTVDGEVGDEDPLAAVRSVLQRRRFDEIIVSTLPAGASRWLRMDLPHRLQRASKLPVEEVTGDEVGDAVEQADPFPGAPAVVTDGPVQVLLVEDNAADAELTRLALARSSTPSEVQTVGNGAEALEWLRSVGGPDGVHLVLVDLKMPVVDGFALLESLGREFDLERMAVVVVTTSDRHEDRSRAHQLGAHAYITKEPVFPVYRSVIDGLLAEVAFAR